MADQFHDSTPAVGNNIADDLPDIAESLGFIKDVFQEIGTGWSNSDATAFTLDKHYKEKKSLSTDSSTTWTGLSANTLYKIQGIVLCSASAYIQARLGNSGGIDSGSNYEDSNYEVGVGQVDENSQTHITVSGQNDLHFLDVKFITCPGDDTTGVINSLGTVNWDTSDNDADQLNIIGYAGYYDGASTIDRIQLYPSTGTFTGSLWLIEMA